MKKFEELVQAAKLNELLGKKEKKTHPILWVLAVIGCIAAVAGIAYAVYRYLTPDFLKDFDDDFDDDFEDDDEEDDDDVFEEET
ncbi:MAG: DUF4366 domain-containing protein [Clostridium sp.]|jgi:hypothetical protein|nr:DUF4366 domain-containing protein [Clostridium sp.]